MIELAQDKVTEREDILFCLQRWDQGDHWFAGSSDAAIHPIHSCGKPAEMKPLAIHQSYVTGVAVAKGKLWSVGYDRLLNEWDIESNRLLSSRKAHSKWIRNIQATRDGRLLSTVGDDMITRIWETETGRLMHALKGHAPRTPQGFSSMLYTCTFSPDGSLLATADRIGEIILWDTASGRIRHRMQAPVMYTWDQVQRLRSIGGIRSLEFSPDQSSLVVGGMGHVQNVDGLGGKARLEWFDTTTGKQTAFFESDTHKGLIEDIRFLPDGSHLIAAGGNNKGFFIVLDLSSHKAVSDPESPMHVHRFNFIDDTYQILAVGHQKTVTWTLTRKNST
ncbi:hypothetical protein OAE97_02415 [Verrucomicrobia bacterium]|nr:hypothetical protein [Verrucomicrobiota bacterium]MDG1890359.1 hypothetical protein [Verrucomicrobiota bacterium]